jgi:prepilin-type N-terminal cleavage/methylation domain-containing protein
MKLCARAAHPFRGGFTLLEVLVALTLAGLLIGAVYSGLSLYWRYSTAGQVEVEQAQLARALLRRIELDVRGVMYAPPAPASSSSSSSQGTSSGSSGPSGSTGNTSGATGTSPASVGSGTASSGAAGGSSGSGSDSSTSTTTTSPDDAYAMATTGLYGNATTLLLNVSRPMREQKATSLALAGNQQTRISDLATVVYSLSGSGTGSLQGAASAPGLARLESDRLAFNMADQQSNTAAMASQTEILASEVIALRFQYYDGFMWRADWDSNLFGGLPKAVDVEVGLRPVASGSRAQRQSVSAAVPTMYRLIIAIPLGKPIETSTITTTK